MDFLHSSKQAFVQTTFSHRISNLSFKTLFEGNDDDRVNNYQLSLVASKNFYSPVHKHNFDQIRYAWKGDFSIGPKMTIKEGELCYHPEGVYYGPQEDDDAERILLLFQFGGASGQGYVDHAILRAANRTLEKCGKFEGGKYYPDAGGNPVDGFQALWEHVHDDRKLEYPQPRYRAPILLTPENFGWTPVRAGDGADGGARAASRKLLGVFSERGMLTQELKLDASGSLQIAADDATQFLMVRAGSGFVGDEPVEVETAVRLQPGTGAHLRSDAGMVLLHYILPTIR